MGKHSWEMLFSTFLPFGCITVGLFGFDMYESEMYPALRSSPRVEEEEEQVALLLAIKILVKCRPVHVSNRTALNIRP